MPATCSRAFFKHSSSSARSGFSGCGFGALLALVGLEPGPGFGLGVRVSLVLGLAAALPFPAFLVGAGLALALTAVRLIAPKLVGVASCNWGPKSGMHAGTTAITQMISNASKTPVQWHPNHRCCPAHVCLHEECSTRYPRELQHQLPQVPTCDCEVLWRRSWPSFFSIACKDTGYHHARIHVWYKPDSESFRVCVCGHSWP